MASLALFFAGAMIFGAIMFTGGWLMRGHYDRYRAERAREDARDDA
jgi:hypothetical protein